MTSSDSWPTAERRRVVRRLGGLALGLSLALVTVLHADLPISALDPFDIVLDGRHELVGVTVAADGTVYVADRGAGIVYRLAPEGALSQAVSGLDRPAGLALDAEGRLLIAEEHAGRIRRLEATNALTVLATDIRTPRWLVVGADGDLYVTAHRLAPPDGADTNEGRTVLRLVPGGSPTVVASDLDHVESLTRLEGGLVVASKGLVGAEDSAGMLLRYPVLTDGTLGAPTTWVGTGLKQPVGLALDPLGSVYASMKELDVAADAAKRAIGKLAPDLRLTDYAANLTDPQGVALGPDGSLYLADGKAGRLVRFRAPPAPTVAAPAFTSLSSAGVTGTTVAGARIDLFANGAATPVTVTADAAGVFSASVALAPNVSNTLEVFATSHHGLGLTGTPAAATIVHDAVRPTVGFTQPTAGAYLRATVSVTAQALDAGKVASLALNAGALALAPSLTPAPPASPLTASATWDTTTFVDGAHTLTATATDRAGNTTTVTRAVIVDNTPPDTLVTGGPTGTTQATEATFTFTGTDDLTPAASLVFAWRLDGGAWTALTSATTATLSSLATGPHTFEVKAQDLAGNEDPTPARQDFTVGGLRVTITEPADGASITEGATLVRGTVEAGGAEAGVTVNHVPAATERGSFAVVVPLVAGETALTAVATTASGATASHTVAITVRTASPVTLLATPQSGVAPLTVSFSLLTPILAVSVAADFDGNGTIDFTGAALDGQRFTYTQPGLYFPSATIMDDQGNRRTATAVVQVYARAELDALLQAKWSDFKASLRRGDVEGALQFVMGSRRAGYREVLNALTVPLSNVDVVLRDVSFVSAAADRVEYQMIRVDGGVRLSYMVIFVRDEDGLWRLEFF